MLSLKVLLERQAKNEYQNTGQFSRNECVQIVHKAWVINEMHLKGVKELWVILLRLR